MVVEYNPKVSIIIPVYNGSNYLSEAIDSALSQTYENIEIIVVNDGSCDCGATEEIAKSYGDRIKYFSKNNGGVSSALNFGIQKMTGDWFSWLSHDDLYNPGKIEHSIDIVRSYQDASSKLIVYSDGYLVRENRSIIRKFKHLFVANKIYSGIEAAGIMAQKGTLCGCSLLIPREVFSSLGGFDENLRYSQDSLMWYRIFLNGYSICSCGEKDVLSRVHKNQVTNTRKDLFVQDSLYVANLLGPELLRNREMAQIGYNYVKRLTKLNCDKTVSFLISMALKNKVFSKKQLFTLYFTRFQGKFVYWVKYMVRRMIVR